MPSGAILGIGGPPPCETFTAARLLADGPPPVRSHDELWGLPSKSQRQWAQTSLGNTLMRFILDMCICRTSGIPDVGSPSEALGYMDSSGNEVARRLQCASYVTFDQCVFGCPRRKKAHHIITHSSAVAPQPNSTTGRRRTLSTWPRATCGAPRAG